MSNPAPDTQEHFDAWLEKQEVKYKLVVEVNDEQVFASDYASADDLYEEARKPERAVEEKLRAEYEYEFKLGDWAEDDEA